MEYNELPTTAPAIQILESHDSTLSVAERRHGIGWSRFTKDPAWLQASLRARALPFLAGKGLKQGLLENNLDIDVYAALVSLDWSGDLRFEGSCPSLRDCLQEHDWDDIKHEARIKNTRITLNLWEWLAEDPEFPGGCVNFTVVSNLRETLFEYRNGTYYIEVMYLIDNGNKGQAAWDVRTVEVDTPSWDGLEFVLTCDNYIYEGAVVSWPFIDSRALQVGTDDAESGFPKVTEPESITEA